MVDRRVWRYIPIPTPSDRALRDLRPLVQWEDGMVMLGDLPSGVWVAVAPCGRSVLFIPDDMPREAVRLLAGCRPRLKPGPVRMRAPRLTVRVTESIVAPSPVERAVVAHMLLLEAEGRPFVFHEKGSEYGIDVTILDMDGEAFDRCLRFDGDAFTCGACPMGGDEWDGLLRRLEDAAARRCDELDDRRERLERTIAYALLPFTALAGLQTVVELWDGRTPHGRTRRRPHPRLRPSPLPDSCT